MKTIRLLEKTDLPKIEKAFTDQKWDGRKEVLEMYWLEQNKQERMVFVAETNGKIAGYVTLIKKIAAGPFKESRFPEIADFNVFLPYQRKGWGNALLEAAEEEAGKLSDTVTLGVGLHRGYGAAQRIYAKRGYVPDGSGIWFENKRLDIGEVCYNNDDLVLYWSKKLQLTKRLETNFFLLTVFPFYFQNH